MCDHHVSDFYSNIFSFLRTGNIAESSFSFFFLMLRATCETIGLHLVNILSPTEWSRRMKNNEYSLYQQCRNTTPSFFFFSSKDSSDETQLS